MVSRVAATPSGDTTWRLRAACKPGSGHDPELWFPAYRRGAMVGTRAQQRAATQRVQKRVADAKEVCRTCTVREECLDYALSHDEKEGIWGGQTPAERGVTPLR